jgi:hypothetical protein
MAIIPTNRTAALAGAWCGLGSIAREALEERYAMASVASHNLAFLSFAVLFLCLPAHFFVFGHGSEAFGRTWFLQPEERKRYFLVFKRMLCWLVAAGAVMVLGSFL